MPVQRLRGIAKIFSPQTASMIAAYQTQALTVPYVSQNIMGPAAFTAINLPQALPVLQGHVCQPFQTKPNSDQFFGRPGGFTCISLWMIYEYVNRSQVPPRHRPYVSFLGE